MTLCRTYSVAIVGVEGHVVEVEADLAQGIPGSTLIGLPDTSLHEARDRIRAAISNSGRGWPQKRITIGLSPAMLPKRGSSYDLAMAAAVLGADGAVPMEQLHRLVLIGELGLDGRVRAVRGVLPAVLAAVRAGLHRVVVPPANVAEAALVPGAQPIGVRSLRHLIDVLCGDDQPVAAAAAAPEQPPGDHPAPDLADVVGQQDARTALEIAAAGGHHLYLLGPPGAGKTMLAERLPGLLPPLEFDDSLEVTAVHSVAGVLPPQCPLVTRPPFQSPHHTASVASVIGGGSSVIRPGVISLAHRGVLFLDEAPEFAGGVLDTLRQPLEGGTVTVSRALGQVTFPARFLLVLAANPCPCAPASPAATCSCTPHTRRRYTARLSGPLLDRIDLRLGVHRLTRADLLVAGAVRESTAEVAARVAAARRRAADRLAGTPWRTNAEVPGEALRTRWPLPRAALARAARALEGGQLTARGYDRVCRVAWTLADLAERDQPTEADMLRALDYRLATAVAA